MLASSRETALARLDGAERALAEAPTLRARIVRTDTSTQRYRDLRQTIDVALARPGSSRIAVSRARRIDASEPWRDTGNDTLTVTANGERTLAFFHPASVQARREKAPSAVPADSPLVDGFFGPSSLSRLARGAEDLREEAGEVRFGEWHVAFGPGGEVRRAVRTSAGRTTEWSVTAWRPGAAIPAREFAYRIPEDALPWPEGTPGGRVPEIGDPAPAVPGLAELRGRPVVLEFFATWCWSCGKALPETARLVRSVPGAASLRVAIRGSRADLTRFERRTKFAGTVWEDPRSPSLSTAYAVTMTPTTLVIDREGRIAARFEGFAGPSPELASALRSAAR